MTRSDLLFCAVVLRIFEGDHGLLLNRGQLANVTVSLRLANLAVGYERYDWGVMEILTLPGVLLTSAVVALLCLLIYRATWKALDRHLTRRRKLSEWNFGRSRR